MTVTYLRLIPDDPYYVPPTQAQSVAQQELSQLLPKAAEISTTVSDTAKFVDQGENFESVSCPFCDNDLEEWWKDAMNEAYKTLFENLTIVLPCCHQQTSLNDLHYQFPAGFSRFVLSARNPDSYDLATGELEQIGTILGCRIKQIWATY